MKPATLFFCILGFPAMLLAKDASDSGYRDPFATENSAAAAPQRCNDPIEPFNRVVYRIDDKLYFWLLKPVSQGFRMIAPEPVRTCLDRAFANAKFPIRFVNNVLQGKAKGAGIEMSRFVVNSTVGLGGLFDPAVHWKLNSQPARFDQTLATYRIPTGCYIYLPLLGPSSIRGAFGEAGDAALTPWSYLGIPAVTYGVPPAEMITHTSLHLGEYETLKKGTLDPYVAIRSAYFDNLQSRDKQ